MSRPDNSGYDPFDSGGSPQTDGSGYGGGSGYGDGSGYGGGSGYGNGSGYGGYYSAPSGNPHAVPGFPGGQPNVSTGTGLAVSALVLGLLSVVTAPILIGGLLAIIGIILAFFALRTGSKARKLGSTRTGGTTAMSVIGIAAAIVGLLIFAFMVWAVVVGGGAAMDCQHLLDNQTAFDACVEESLMGRLGLN